MRIVQLASLVTPTSGGIRTVLDHLARGYRAAGHEVHRIVPETRGGVTPPPAGAVHPVPGVPIPGAGGYRLVVRRAPVRALLDEMRPDAIEVHDHFTLGWVGAWAAEHGVVATLVAHERLSTTLRTWGVIEPLATIVAGRVDASLAARFDHVVVPSDVAAEGFARAGVDPATVQVVPLGVDLSTFSPAARSRTVDPDRDGPVRLVAVTRLSREKRPATAVAAVDHLRRRGVDARLQVVGDGPLRTALTRRAQGLPVTLLGHVADRRVLARVVADADVALATCPVETFGLAALEALACGTPVAAVARGALRSLVGGAGPGGVVVPPGASSLADGVCRLLARDVAVSREAARRRAAQFTWDRTVRTMLAVHGAVDGPDTPPRRATVPPVPAHRP